ncbi:hypothetical protein PFISCL1PPCAC_27417 [Pristionchus fissidentatus]|uniref:Neurotransmitter-gated ion-channel ligand-binding domain-containing protein n=1 Tax=Pristionchus fissidentatus TaxID=1538716 RepID=A0AAV5WZR0_9BILA|nr:hypothetical protein PFISCL1PPCAC_27417 [Pristionchus fissidentatus]
MGRLLFLGIFLFSLLVVSQAGDPEGESSSGPQPDEDEESFYNRTYAETQNKLQMDIFKHYNRNERPVKDPDSTVEVDIHLHVTHVSFNQNEQTMTVHGHMYMSWIDEKLSWNPKDYDGVTQTNVKKWQIWMPDIKVSNSINGVYSAHDISRNSHITLQAVPSFKTLDMTPDRVKVETYPTFAMKVGCIMDYSDYPYDDHVCAVRIFTPRKMREVSLSVYRGMPPTMFLSWSNETQKLSSGEFTIYRATNNITYQRKGGNGKTYDESVPVTGNEAQRSWTTYNMYVYYKRHSGHYSVSVIVPLGTTMTLSLVSLIIRDIQFATLLNGATFALHSLFVRDFIKIIPTSVYEIPQALYFHGMSVALTIFIFIFNLTIWILCSQRAAQNFLIDKYSRLYNLLPVNPFPSFFDTVSKNLGDIRTRGWMLNANVWRAQLCLVLSFAYLILFTRAFLI